MINKVCKLYDNLLNIYPTKHDNLLEDSNKKKKINALNRPGNLNEYEFFKLNNCYQCQR